MNLKIKELANYKIGVLAGGNSSERDISLKSGWAVFEALESAELNVKFIDLDESDSTSMVSRGDIELVFIALHGKFGEDGKFQSLLEEQGILYTGSGPEASRAALDKMISKNRFKEVGLLVPSYEMIDKIERINAMNFIFPCVVKPRYEGSSFGLTIVDSEDQLHEAVSKAFEYDNTILIEEYIPGRELTVGIVEGEPLPVVEILTDCGVYDFNAKYASKKTKYIVPAEVKEFFYKKVQTAGLKAHQSLDCRGFSRVDIRFTNAGEIYILEVNTIPGLTERSLLPMAAKAAGLNFKDLCVQMLYSAIQ